MTVSVTELLALDLLDWRRMANQIDAMASILAGFAPDYDTTVQSTRTFGYRGGRMQDGLGGWSFEPDGTIVCTDDATRYVQWDPVNGVTIQASINPLRYLMARVICASGSITKIEDLRDANLTTPERLRGRGVWSAGTYLRNDVVKHGDNLYRALDQTTQEPGTGADWEVMVYGVPDPSTANDDDALLVYGGELFYGPVSSGTGTLDVEDEGTPEESLVTRLNFTGAGVTAVGDGVGGVDVTISGVPGGNPGSFPGGMFTAQEVLLTADAGIGLSDGSSITSWGDQSGNSKDHSNGGGSNRPIYRAADAEDGLEYVEFSGVGNDGFVERTGMTAHTGGELTAYLVARIADNSAGDRLFSLVASGNNDTSSSGGLALHYGSAHQLEVMRNTVPRSGTSVAATGSRCFEVNYGWFVIAFRYVVIMGRAVLQVFHNNRWIGFDLGSGSLTAFDFTISCLGSGYSTAPGTKTGYPQIDVRHWSYTLVADSVADIRASMLSLAGKWNVPILA